jgi:DMSO/TMAO reductase YedYZ molybdopterin-dependent catalytic subunit
MRTASRRAAASLAAIAIALAGSALGAQAKAPAAVGAPLPALALPPRPATVPGYTELDPSTGLHMTGTPQFIDASTWRLKVGGKVARALSLGYDELRLLPRRATRDPIICEGYFEDYASWAGASLEAVLDLAGASPGAKGLELVSADGYSSYLGMAEARSGYALLAYEWNGMALPELHGYPLRAAFPGLPGNKWVKWLVEIKVE